ncbi:tryptophanase-like [Haliotis cracherodii]|uniref:tryptophanase-like n=1 Tax=Haliotis cracherodii TaxID=6455 RepID=UPI0039EA5E01
MDRHPYLTMEPFKIKVVEPLPKVTREERVKHLTAARFEPFCLHSRHVIIDLCTDSGACAMSQDQWAAIMGADESYKNSTSFERFKKSVQTITKFQHVIPVHQGRAAETLLFRLVLKAGSVVASNGLFFTTEHNITRQGGKCIEIPCKETRGNKFGGNIDCEQLNNILDDVTVVVITVTNNERAGQPVSMGNLKRLQQLCGSRSIPVFMDGCRFAENAFFIKESEPGFENKPIQEIVAEMFSCVDGCYVSAKKDGLANTGGFFATHDKELFDKFAYEMLWSEGSPEYGGLTGRDLDAIAVGLQEVIDEDYLRYRVAMSREFGEILKRANVPIIEPVGCAVHVDAEKALTHISPNDYPARALNCALYIEGGVKGVHYSYKQGTTLAEGLQKREVLRLSLPRRVYTLSHLLYVGEVFKRVLLKAGDISGLKRFSEKINYSGAPMVPILGSIFASDTEGVGEELDKED